MNKETRSNQQGIVSIMVTMIMMLVITLIVIGFAQVARRNQRETLDRQLSTQAYYAAESGVNVASQYVQTNADQAYNTLSSGSCNAPLGPASSNPPALPLSLASGVSASCLMINPTPSQLIATPVGQDSSVVFHVKNATNAVFTSLVFTWTPPTNYSGATTCTSSSGGPPATLPVYGNWNCNYGILRVDFIPISGIGEASLDNSSNVKTAYFVPNSSVAGQNPLLLNSSGNAFVRRTKCGGSTDCTGTVTGLTSAEYFVRISTVYQDSSNVTLAASDGSHGNQVGGVQFTQGQAVIDSTGKAQDELRRIQVRVPLYSQQTALPLFGVQSTGSICKELTVASGIYNDGCVGETGVLP